MVIYSGASRVGEELRFLVLLACLAVVALGLAACGGSEHPSAFARDVPPDITLLQAIDFDNVKMVQRHMEYGTDPNEVFIPAGYPFAGASALHQAVLKNNAEIVRLLLENGAQIEFRARDEFEATPLMWAAYWGLFDMAKLLLEEGADVNALDSYGNTPLDAASVENPFIGEKGADAFIENREKIRKLLMENGGRTDN